MLERYEDLLANVRHDGQYHPIRSLVQPQDAEVMAVAAILSDTPDFIAACQDFVDSFTTYAREVGDFWAIPAETMTPHCPLCDTMLLLPTNDISDIYRCACGWQGKPLRRGDCDDKAILLTSLLRNEVPADQVFCAVGDHILGGRREGHMWVVIEYGDEDYILEATAPSKALIRGDYQLMAIFNDAYAFAYPKGLRQFDLRPVSMRGLVPA